MQIQEKNGVKFISASGEVSSLFLLRHGGVSGGEFSSLNVSSHRGDREENVRKNLRIIANAFSFDINKMCRTKQEHTDIVDIITEDKTGLGVTRDRTSPADAIITNLFDVPLICATADCVPVLLYSKNSHSIGAVHAGHRGSYLKIAQKTALLMQKTYNADLSDMKAFIGPHIGKCCYEVGSDVAKNFPKFSEEKENQKFMLDLDEANRFSLKEIGLKDENITSLNLCTRCNNDLFFSHRAQNGKSGVFASIIYQKEENQ